MLLTLARSAILIGAAYAADSARKAAVTVAGYVMVGVLLMASLAFLTFSGYRAICLSLGSVYAALIVGCIYLVLALVAMVAVQMRRR